LFTTNVNGVGIRSMKAPGTAYDDALLGKDPQPAHMRDYKAVSYDNGGVHINSGIPNHAFYVTALEIGGYAWQKAGKIWYAAQCDKLNSNSDFQQAANLTYQAAGEIYGAGSLEQKAVRKGWSEVGIQVDGTSGSGSCLTAAANMFMALVKRISIRRS
jgi:Zn-dependent metalloprotease